jgi:hypothetical protein
LAGNVLVALYMYRPFNVLPTLRSACSGGLSATPPPFGPGAGIR